MTTHQPVLIAVAERCDGPIAEFGCGHGSTPLLHEIATRRGLRVLSLESDRAWLDAFRLDMESPTHQFRHVTDWQLELQRPEWRDRWGLVFIDQDPWEARPWTVATVRHTADYVVVHDCDHGARIGTLGRMIRDVAGAADRGERDYSDLFSSWIEFFPPEPWPWPPTGPPTLLGSNLCDVSEVSVDLESLLPLWWRVGRHSRGLVPQSVRMQIGNLIGWRARLRL